MASEGVSKENISMASNVGSQHPGLAKSHYCYRGGLTQVYCARFGLKLGLHVVLAASWRSMPQST